MSSLSPVSPCSPDFDVCGNYSVDDRLSLFEPLWDSGVRRVGQAGARGWGVELQERLGQQEDTDREVEMMEDEDSSDPTWELSQQEKPKAKKARMKVLKCPKVDCKAKLKSKSSLKQHIDFVHGERERFPCKVPSCNRR